MNNSLAQRLHNLIQTGVIAEIDLAHARCRVQVHTRISGWLPWLAGRAGTCRTWSAPSIGEQVLLLAPEGNPAVAVVLCGLYSDQYPAPSASASGHCLVFADGARIDYDPAQHALSAVLPAGGSAALTADGGITLNGPLMINGDTQINGNAQISQTLNAQSDVIGGGISLKNHAHSGIKPSPGSTGPPQ